VFKLDEWGYASAPSGDIDESEAERVFQAAVACPEAAIFIEE